MPSEPIPMERAFLLEELVLLPAQVLSGFASTPETRLVAAVLAQALDDLTDEDLEARADAAAWIAGEPARVPFEVVAFVLGSDPRALRAAVTRAVIGRMARWEAEMVGGARNAGLLNSSCMFNAL